MAKRGPKKKFDDSKLLYDIYRYRLLSIVQIRSVYFRNSSHYVYKKMLQLKSMGLVDSLTQAINTEKGRRKIATCYFITGEGIDYLKQSGYTVTRRMTDNRPRKEEVNRVIEANELFKLHAFGWEKVDSRDWKTLYSMNRGAEVRAGLKDAEGKEYGVYLFQNSVEEKTIAKIKAEIDGYSQSGRFLFVFKGAKSYRDYLQELTSVELGKIEFCTISYSFIMQRLPFLSSKSHFVKYLTKYGEVETNEHSNNQAFADYILRIDGQEFYVCDYLMSDQAALYRAERYPLSQYKLDGRKIMIVCWEEALSSLQMRFANYEHIKLHGVSLDEYKTGTNIE